MLDSRGCPAQSKHERAAQVEGPQQCVYQDVTVYGRQAHIDSHACAATYQASTPFSKVAWITGAKRGKKFGRFWQHLAYTRVLKSYIEELNLKGYLAANRSEAMLGQEARERMLRAFNKWVYKEQTWKSTA